MTPMILRLPLLSIHKNNVYGTLLYIKSYLMIDIYSRTCEINLVTNYWISTHIFTS